MARKATCELCGERFDAKRDPRRWKATATEVGGSTTKRIVVCTDCFLETAEAEYAL